MRKVLVLIFVSFIGVQLFAGNPLAGKGKEYFMIRVTHLYKNDRIMSELSIDTGEMFPNSLKGKIVEGEGNSIKVNADDGKILVFHNEVDILNYLSTIGWDLVCANPVTILNKTYVEYLFSSDIKN